MPLPPANWYPDPTAPGAERYWDGSGWSASTRAVPAPQAPAAPTFTPQAPAAPTFPPQAPAAPTFTPQAPVSPMFPPPATAEPMRAPKRSRVGLWITLGAVGLLVVGVGVAAVVALASTVAPLSGDYTGAPVTRSDVASPGHRSVVSTSETVAAEIPSTWDAPEGVEDRLAGAGGLPPGASMLGLWFTQSLETATSVPQMVMVMEMTPRATGPGTLNDIQVQVIEGMRETSPNLVFGPSQDYTTALGLEGVRTDATYEMVEQNLSCTVAVITVAHGRRFVVVTWTSFDEPVDEPTLEAFMAALRVDA